MEPERGSIWNPRMESEDSGKGWENDVMQNDYTHKNWRHRIDPFLFRFLFEYRLSNLRFHLLTRNS